MASILFILMFVIVMYLIMTSESDFCSVINEEYVNKRRSHLSAFRKAQWQSHSSEVKEGISLEEYKKSERDRLLKEALGAHAIKKTSARSS